VDGTGGLPATRAGLEAATCAGLDPGLPATRARMEAVEGGEGGGGAEREREDSPETSRR